MKRLLYVLVLVAALGSILTISPAINAQEWTAAQKEVWQVEETFMKLSADGNVEAFLSYVHPDYVGWINVSPYPQNKESTSKFVYYYMKSNKSIVNDSKPMSIKIYGNVAIVHYYYSNIYKDADGKVNSEVGRWTDIFMKQGDRWLLIGDAGGAQIK